MSESQGPSRVSATQNLINSILSAQGSIVPHNNQMTLTEKMRLINPQSHEAAVLSWQKFAAIAPAGRDAQRIFDIELPTAPNAQHTSLNSHRVAPVAQRELRPLLQNWPSACSMMNPARWA